MSYERALNLAFETQMLRSTIAAIMLSIVVPLAASAETWRNGFGQGVLEAWVEKGPGNKINIACESGWGRPITGISSTLAGQSPAPHSTVTLTFDAKDPVDVRVDEIGSINSNCRACAGWLELVRDQLKASGSVYVRFCDGLGTRFGLKGAANAIGECQADFWKTF